MSSYVNSVIQSIGTLSSYNVASELGWSFPMDGVYCPKSLVKST